jgi:hypothetical protein
MLDRDGGAGRSEKGGQDESSSNKKGKRGAKSENPRAVRNGRGRPPQPAQIEVDMRAYISRKEAGRLIAKSQATMRRYEDVWFRETKIAVGKGKVIYYPRKQFDELRASFVDDTGFKCYALFARGLGPHDVTMKLRHKRPALVRQYFYDYLADVELQQSRVVIDLDPEMSSRDWKRGHGFDPDKPIHPQWIKRAVQFCALIEEQRKACDLHVAQWEGRKRRGRPRKSA